MEQLLAEIEKINAMEVVKRPFPLPGVIVSTYTTGMVADMANCKQYQVEYWCRNNQVKKLDNTGIFIMSLEEVEAFHNRPKKGWPKGKARK